MIPTKPDPIPFTKQEYEKIQTSYKHLQAEREQILIRLQTAREQGDLSENGAYKYAKFELGNTNRRLRQLGHFLRYGFVAEKKSTDSADFGNTITLSGHRDITFTLVSEHESNPSQNKLSIKSPIGAACLGKKVGDTVLVSSPNGSAEYTIAKIS